MERARITLTVREIYDLACFAGLSLNSVDLESADDDSALVIYEVDAIPLINAETGRLARYRHVAASQANPEEGLCALGHPLEEEA